jgi:hypothetical protein
MQHARTLNAFLISLLLYIFTAAYSSHKFGFKVRYWIRQTVASASRRKPRTSGDVVASGQALPRGRELAKLYLKSPSSHLPQYAQTFHSTLEGAYLAEKSAMGYPSEGACVADLVKSTTTDNEPTPRQGKVA